MGQADYATEFCSLQQTERNRVGRYTAECPVFASAVTSSCKSEQGSKPGVSCNVHNSQAAVSCVLQAYLEVTTADEQVHFAAFNLLEVRQGGVDVVKLPMAAALYCNLGVSTEGICPRHVRLGGRGGQ